MLKIRKALFMTPKYYIAIFLSILLIGCSFVVDSEELESIDHCEPNPCLNGSECIPTSETYFCNCTDSWDGDNCEISNSPLVGTWKFLTRELFTNGTCNGVPDAIYDTNSPEWLATFPVPTSQFQLTVAFNSDLTFTQTMNVVPVDVAASIKTYISTGRIEDTGIEKCNTWDPGSSGSCEDCGPYTIIDDTLRTTNYCSGAFAPCEIWTSIKH